MTSASWRRGNDISEEKREWFRQKSIASASRKRRLTSLKASEEPLRESRLDIEKLMPTLSPSSIDSISLFSGCGGLDIGFERAGFDHVLSIDISKDALLIAKSTNNMCASLSSGPCLNK